MRIFDRYVPTLVCVMIALGSSSASAISVVLLTQDRSISASASGSRVIFCCPEVRETGSDSDSDAAVGFEVFDSSVSASAPIGSSFASQLSTLSSSLISASVHTTASGEQSVGSGGSGTASSVFRISFSATEATPYLIEGSFLTQISAFSAAFATVEISLLDSLGGLLWRASGASPPGPPGLIEFANFGVLAPGDYRLEATAQSNGTPGLMSFPASATADFDFAFSIVPEPSTAASLALGLVLLGLRNGSRKKR